MGSMTKSCRSFLSLARWESLSRVHARCPEVTTVTLEQGTDCAKSVLGHQLVKCRCSHSLHTISFVRTSESDKNKRRRFTSSPPDLQALFKTVYSVHCYPSGIVNTSVVLDRCIPIRGPRSSGQTKYMAL